MRTFEINLWRMLRRRAVTLTANFAGTPQVGNDPLLVSFTDLSTGAPTSWLWERRLIGTEDWFTFSEVQHPSEIEFNFGWWDIRLTATNGSGSHSKTEPAYIQVDAA
jgi:PKD repeat protein